MSSSHRILTGLVAGIAVGVFLGERATAFGWAADGFVKLLQMTVLPYVTLSIVTSLGSLSYAEARMLGIRAGAVLAGLWALALVYALLIPLAFPHVQTASFFSTTLVERRPPFNFVDLYIPSNPFNSLANNVVPAVVLFSVVLGVALIGVERKQALLDVLEVAAAAVSRATRLAVKLTPFGLFAIAADAAGTLNLEQLGRLQVYLVTYVAVALLVGLWVLPGLIAALTPIRIREIFSLTRDALITATVAGDLFIVLPVLIEASKTLLARHHPPSSAIAALPDVIVPASFNFPHTGKLLSLSFILFAGWFADAAVPKALYPQLALTGLLTFFGSLNAAVPFLLDLFRIPADTFQLFLATGVINSRVGTLVAAMHTVAVALLGACAIGGTLRFDRRRVVRYLAITVVLTVVVIGGTRAVFAGILRPEYTRDKVLVGMHLLRETDAAVVLRTAPAPEPADSTFAAATVGRPRPILQSIRDRGSLRVGYLPDALPFAFFNGHGDLVGFDVELAHRLARELGVRLELRPVSRATIEAQLSSGYCDLVMSGVAVTTGRAAEMLFSVSYLDETLGLVVRDQDRDAFSTWRAIAERPATTIAVPDLPYYIDKIRQAAPRAQLQIVTEADVATMVAGRGPQFDAIATTAERGSTWTLLYPQFSVVVPEPGIVKVPLAYPIAKHDEAFASFINTWIDLKRKDGTISTLYDYWVLGRDAAPRRPRWSIIRDVLHWVE
jgi:Na+/H+-dicarboxylate symporter/ABC-type amino acid transport substrate-binding protein